MFGQLRFHLILAGKALVSTRNKERARIFPSGYLGCIFCLWHGDSGIDQDETQLSFLLDSIEILSLLHFSLPTHPTPMGK